MTDPGKYFTAIKKHFGTEKLTELYHTNEFTLTVAVALPAQATDKHVNTVTPKLFAVADTPEKMLALGEAGLKEIIKSISFFNNKAKNIIGMARAVISDFGGVIPNDINDLVKLPGVGRKTASVFLAEYFKLPAIAVDTHVIRVSNRLGLTKSKNPDIIERDLAKLIDKKDWRLVNLYLVLFGRYYCKAKKPMCDTCKLKRYCEFS